MTAANLARLLDHVAERQPDAPAIIMPDKAVQTWSQLQNTAAAIQQQIQKMDIGPSSAVMIMCANSPKMVASMWGILRAGCVLTPVNVKATVPELSYMIKTVSARAIIVDADKVAAVKAACEELGSPPVILCTSAHPDARPLTDVELSRPDQPDCAEVQAEDHAWYFFTSGTTGRPKAAILTHGQMSFVVNNHIGDLMPGLSCSDVSIAIAPLSHGAGVHMLANTAKGSPTVLLETASLDAAKTLDAIEYNRVTNFFSTPTILKILAAEQLARQRDLTALKHAIYAGEPMHRADQVRALKAFGRSIVQYYGLAEVTGIITVLPADEHSIEDSECRIGSAGYVRTGMDIKIVDPKLGKPVQRYHTGEICARGLGVFAGYLHNPEATSEALRDGWFHTGDLGHLDDAGYLYITGRKSDMFISGGMNVYPREVENALLLHAGIVEAAVFGVPHSKWGEVGICAVVFKDRALSQAALRDYLRPMIAPYKIPKVFVALPQLEKTAYGKIAKQRIRETVLNDHYDILTSTFGPGWSA